MNKVPKKQGQNKSKKYLNFIGLSELIQLLILVEEREKSISADCHFFSLLCRC